MQSTAKLVTIKNGTRGPNSPIWKFSVRSPRAFIDWFDAWMGGGLRADLMAKRHGSCGITTFNPTTRNEGGLEVRERSLVRCPRGGINVQKGLDKEGRHTRPVALSRSEVLKPNVRSRIRSLRLKGKPEWDSN